MITVHDYARRELSARFNGADLSAFTNAVIEDAADNMFLGGWQALQSEYREWVKSTTSPKSPSPVQIRLMAAKALGRDLRVHDHVLVCELSGETSRMLTVSFATVEERVRFDHVVARTIEMYLWTRNPDTGEWDLSTTSFPQQADERHYHAADLSAGERDVWRNLSKS